jgi:tricorn protease
MMTRGWAEFHRDRYTEFRRDGLMVDLRDTQGGDAGQLVAEKLARRIIGWNFSRYEEPLSYPADAHASQPIDGSTVVEQFLTEWSLPES